jgi:hypothetical protein
MKAIDFIENDEGELLENATGDFVEDESDGQHIQSIFEVAPGDLHYQPLIGVGITKNVKGVYDGHLRKKVFTNLEADNYSVNKLIISKTGQINIDAERNS